jgi:alpha-L-fucosidase
LIRHLQPGAVIMGKGPDVRWVGNEGGVGRTTEWSVIPLPMPPDQCRWPDLQAGDLGSRAKLVPGSHLWWYPAEVNMTILDRDQWFWGPRKHPRSLTELVDVYYRSIGRNGNLILNLSPDSRGLIPDDQLEALDNMARIIKDTFRADLAAGGHFSADAAAESHDASLALDGNLDTWWEAAPGRTNATLTLALPSPVTFDVVSLQEAVDRRGQRIESFAIDAWNGTEWVPVHQIKSDELTTVGHRRLIRLQAPVTASQVRVRITGSRMEPTLAEFGLFKQSIYALAPIISDRGGDNRITISNAAGCKMVYTVDGSQPAPNSPVYESAILLPATGAVQAACVMPNGQLGIVASRTFAGLSPRGWKVVATDSQETAGDNNGASNAIDGDSATFWHTRWNQDLTLPHFLTVDMGMAHRIGGFAYLPRQDGNPNGTVEDYRFETSMDGSHWSTNIVSGTFANVRNNPSLQQATFAPVDARFFRFTALKEINGNGWTSAAEITVLPAASE